MEASATESRRMIFWILTTPRSGSNYVTGEVWRRLGGTPKPMEYFHPESVKHRPDFTPDPAAPVRSYLDYLWPRESLGGLLAVKMLWSQVEACCRYPDFIPQLAGRKIVVLRRRDVVRQGVSLYITRQTGSWASEVAPRRRPLEEVTYDREAIASSVARMELHNAMLERFLVAFGLEHLSVRYEDFAADPEAGSSRILDYLGLAPVTGPRPDAEVFRRQSTDLNEEFLARFLADERTRLCGDGTYRGPPLFPPASSASG